ncbi:hypothetical protein FKF97_16500 [Clostridium perfringens]|uniref:hypothetical protein n=1 Tax=Clostridium perfringens TaxID=1502 RepID=UPI00096A6071|nr:hypothetical protein [Clostridium perfringens]EGT3607972.1 hypothetical protein [Clostridium perfringens]
MGEKKTYNYSLCDDKDNTIKQFFERHWVIPKNPENYKFSKEEEQFLKKHMVMPISENVLDGKNGYIVFRGRRPRKLTEDMIKQIQSSDLSQRALAKIYNVSVATINKAKKGEY